MIEFELLVIILLLACIRNHASKITRNLIPKGESSAVILSAKLMEEIQDEQKQTKAASSVKREHSRHMYTTSLN